MVPVFSEEQTELRQTVRRFCEEKFPEAVVRRVMETDEGFDAAAWQQMAQQLGLQSLAIPEEFGGAGFSLAEQGIVMEELGRSLGPTPFLSTVVLAANLLIAVDDAPAKEEILAAIAAGESRAAVAFLELSQNWDEDGIQASAERGADGWALSGTKTNVIDGHTADLLLVLARTSKGISVFRVDPRAAGVRATAVETLDLTRKQAIVVLDNAPAELIGSEGAGWEALEQMLLAASVALASENVGGALKLLELSAEYARTREQFGKVIGSYQAIKQKLADVLLDVELARAAAHRVARAASEHDPALPQEAAMAHALTADTFVKAAYEAIQVHGGIGFTWEHPAHLYFRRAKSNELLFGTPDHQREVAARHLGL
ncbi:acyl-CoA dehydrogenase family protein [Arthrobacter sp. MMS18-M83]|uniref:acyl-CoA dehydrogenase family protein n=1 Tax=Arthrobacter sp. MMS18-M83 TaxID=2996261 RepID=UPI00227B181C|nr:acyl-CoA dehydrogenase family protein [Arthrobacter sp. MMS18-M83]WAH96314.1 acyl-CoA/acyl-ACP dehydrogenase [Arthrobacter sp. MMS18-M83]